MKVRMATTKILLKIHSAIENIIAITIHRTMLKITPAIPSPMSAGPSEAKLGVTSGVSIVLNLSTILPRLSLSLTPLYRPTVTNKKNAIDRMVVDKIEFSKNV